MELQFSLRDHQHSQYLQKTQAYTDYVSRVELLDTTALTIQEDVDRYIPLVVMPYTDLSYDITQNSITYTANGTSIKYPWWQNETQDPVSQGDLLEYVFQTFDLYWGPMPISQYSTADAKTYITNLSGLNEGFELKTFPYLTGYHSYSSAVRYFADHIGDMDSGSKKYYKHIYFYFYSIENLKKNDPDMARYIKSSLDILTFSDILPFLLMVGYIDIKIPMYLNMKVKVGDGTIVPTTTHTYQLRLDMLSSVHLTNQVYVQSAPLGSGNNNYISQNLKLISGAAIPSVTVDLQIGANPQKFGVTDIEHSQEVRTHFVPRIAGIQGYDTGSTDSYWRIRVASFGVPFTLFILAKVSLKGVIS